MTAVALRLFSCRRTSSGRGWSSQHQWHLGILRGLPLRTPWIKPAPASFCTQHRQNSNLQVAARARQHNWQHRWMRICSWGVVRSFSGVGRPVNLTPSVRSSTFCARVVIASCLHDWRLPSPRTNVIRWCPDGAANGNATAAPHLRTYAPRSVHRSRGRSLPPASRWPGS